MLLNLLVGYTAFMVFVGFAMIVREVLELAADELALMKFEGDDPGQKFFNKLLKDIELEASKTDEATAAKRTGEKLLQALETVPFPLRSYGDRKGHGIARIHRVMARLREKTARPETK
jgi:hypothetical protein